MTEPLQRVLRADKPLTLAGVPTGFFPWLAEYLCNSGFAVCRFNMSRSGIGENPETFDRLDLFAGDTYSIQLADLSSATHFAQGVPAFVRSRESMARVCVSLTVRR